MQLYGNQIQRGVDTIKKKNWEQYIGSEFYDLRVIGVERDTNNKSGKMLFRCICKCGTEKVICANNVLRGRSKSCGCGERLSRYSRNHTKDIRGQKFGNLTVIRDSGRRASNGAAIWVCKCDCGKDFDCPSGSLLQGRVMDCGCNKVHANTSDIEGCMFGDLTVLHIDRDNRSGDRLHWLCKCICGNLRSITTNELTSGRAISCGCTKGSHGERYIADLLSEHGIAFEQQKRFDDCRNMKPLPFDFYLPTLHTVIEYDGKQHYAPVKFWGGEDALRSRQRLDEIKNTYCEENNIRLVRLPYTMSRTEIAKTIATLGTRNE